MWNELTKILEVDEIAQDISGKQFLLFKHSTRCSVSFMAQRELNSKLEELSKHFSLYYLDLISYRDVSNYIAEKFGVHHESPQVLIIENGKCISHFSHYEIDCDSLLSQLC